MNATARASLIAVAAIVGACWAIPALLASVVPSDGGMVAMMALLYALLPITAVVLGLLAASSPRTLFWVPAALGIAFALLLPPRGRGQPGPLIPRRRPCRDRLCRHGHRHLDDAWTRLSPPK